MTHDFIHFSATADGGGATRTGRSQVSHPSPSLWMLPERYTDFFSVVEESKEGGRAGSSVHQLLAVPLGVSFHPAAPHCVCLRSPTSTTTPAHTSYRDTSAAPRPQWCLSFCLKSRILLFPLFHPGPLPTWPLSEAPWALCFVSHSTPESQEPIKFPTLLSQFPRNLLERLLEACLNPVMILSFLSAATLFWHDRRYQRFLVADLTSFSLSPPVSTQPPSPPRNGQRTSPHAYGLASWKIPTPS